jgi:hypothetical protein
VEKKGCVALRRSKPTMVSHNSANQNLSVVFFSYGKWPFSDTMTPRGYDVAVCLLCRKQFQYYDFGVMSS